MGLPQWGRQLQATKVSRLKEALLPACPDGSSDSIAPDWRIVPFGHHVGPIPTAAGIELTDLLVAESFDRKFNETMAFEIPVVKNPDQ